MEKEPVKEPPLHNPSIEGLKVTVTCQEGEVKAEGTIDTDVCHKSNGVAESEPEAAAVIDSKPDTDFETLDNTSEIMSMDGNTQADLVEPVPPNSEPVAPSVEAVDVPPESVPSNEKEDHVVAVEDNEQDKENRVEESIDSIDLKVEESVVEIGNECAEDTVTFQTEIVIESNDNEIIEPVCDEIKMEEQTTNNILGELGESIELSEALRSSDVTDNIENNNCAGKQELFNKEELLDILQGNDDQVGNTLHSDYQTMRGKKILETKIALQQLTYLKKQPKKRAERVLKPETKSSKTTTPEIKREAKIVKSKPEKTPNIVKKCEENIVKSKPEKIPTTVKKCEENIVKSKPEKTPTTVKKGEENIVKNIVKDWDDDEEREEKCTQLLEDSENLPSEVVIIQEDSIKVEEDSNRSLENSHLTEHTPSSSNKSGDESQPQRRLGRVIKKKVIFDPDNPDTFTKTKAVKNKDPQGQEKESTPAKKVKSDSEQRSKSKSPLSKLQWKKPCIKNNKQNKRLTEVDKLLMDEGAVNMIYQLTPEAPKGKKNMKTKAEFIKKIQSSSQPDSKEMKFRERKKECKYDESEPRKILGGKQRPSLNSSVKSPSVSEDFEAHSADDSIIYRRHSSSSYSSSCMSPRRLSDVEITGQVTRNNQQVDVQNVDNKEGNNERPALESSTFMADSSEATGTETINKNDCLSIKEKLNSKLNLALNKRKRENSKIDKPAKQKKIMKVSQEKSSSNPDFKHLSVRFEEKLAVVCVQKPGSISNVEIIKELESALKVIDLKKDISLTLLMPDCGVTYSDLDLSSVLDEDLEIRTSHAYELAESIRSLLHTAAGHSKLLCAGVNSRCTGVALALVALSDVALSSERASFSITAKSQGPGPIEPGVSVLTAYRNLPQPMLNELVIFGRRLSATEAHRNGLVSRVLWPEKFNEQVLNIATDIAAQPSHNIWLKKQMLSLKNRCSDTFLNSLEKERDLFLEYWISEEGQELLRTIHHVDTEII